MGGIVSDFFFRRDNWTAGAVTTMDYKLYPHAMEHQ